MSSIRSTWFSTAVCTALLAMFAAVSWRAAVTKSPTFDEPYHVMSAWVQLHDGDYRVDPEDPPLWKFWLALANGPAALTANFSDPNWTQQPREMWRQWNWCVDTLYHTPGNDPERFVQRSRAMMLVWGVVLGAAIAAWAFQLGGVAAAVVATSLFCLDPNFLAHAALAKNDVLFSLAMLALVHALWRAGRRLTWAGAGWIGVLCGVCLTVKFTGVLAAMLVPLMMAVRAAGREPWPALGKLRSTRGGRLVVAADVTFVAAVVAVGCIWLVYRCRFDPTPHAGVLLDTQQLAQMATANEVILHAGPGAQPTTRNFAAATPGLAIRVALGLEHFRLLPQAFVAGFLFTYQSTLLRISYCCGQLSRTGWWYYFPLAMAVKTPVGTLAFLALGAIVAVWRRTSISWLVLCLAVPTAFYLAAAMHSNLNIGIRHVLPIEPLMFIAAGLAASAAVRRWGGPAILACALLILGLAAESLSAYPDFIPFFNIAAGGKQNGIKLLGDSNLDWGQDLKLLRHWQADHPTTPLYLSYFGLADPAAYGIRATPVVGGYHYGPPPSWPKPPCALAISATYLQGLFEREDLYQQFYSQFVRQKPAAVLGGSIYVFNLLGARQPDRPADPTLPPPP